MATQIEKLILRRLTAVEKAVSRLRQRSDLLDGEIESVRDYVTHQRRRIDRLSGKDTGRTEDR